jgi:anthranilate synthase component 1
VHGEETRIQRGRKRETRKGNALTTLKSLLAEHSSPKLEGVPPFTGGAVGFFAYDFVRQLERLPSKAKQLSKTPDAVFLFFDRVLAFDHLKHEIHIIVSADVRKEKPKTAYERAQREIEKIARKLSMGVPAASLRRRKKPAGKLKISARTSPQQFMNAVRSVKEYIAAGDIFQCVLSQRFEFEPGAQPFDIYRALRRVNPSPYLYFLRTGDRHILGSSPEMLVRVQGRTLDYRPIAGTRKRGVDEASDAKLEAELMSNEKERAEHVMLVDLGRNDLGRVSEYGSVKVKSLMYVERYSHVMHLVSALQSQLRGDLSALDAFASCFPAGTLTGAPKIRAMQIIDELEPVRRGVYGGSVFYADFSGNLDSCIAIRTMVLEGKKGILQAGAGIVADSDPAAEHEECLNKARAVLRAVELARTGA